MIPKENGPFELYHIEQCLNSDCKPVKNKRTTSSYRSSRRHPYRIIDHDLSASTFRTQMSSSLTSNEWAAIDLQSTRSASLNQSAVSVRKLHIHERVINVLNPHMQPPGTMSVENISSLNEERTQKRFTKSISPKAGMVRVSRLQSNKDRTPSVHTQSSHLSLQSAASTPNDSLASSSFIRVLHKSPSRSSVRRRSSYIDTIHLSANSTGSPSLPSTPKTLKSLPTVHVKHIQKSKSKLSRNVISCETNKEE